MQKKFIAVDESIQNRDLHRVEDRQWRQAWSLIKENPRQFGEYALTNKPFTTLLFLALTPLPVPGVNLFILTLLVHGYINYSKHSSSPE